MKKLLAIVLALVLVLSMTACSTSSGTDHHPEDYDQTGTCGENAQWGYVEKTGELTISGTGEMDDYSFEQFSSTAPWSELEIKSVSIQGVTNIGNVSFTFCNDLTKVSIPDSVTTIGDHAFYNCTGLTEITIPNSVTSI